MTIHPEHMEKWYRLGNSTRFSPIQITMVYFPHHIFASNQIINSEKSAHGK